jgi:hypothetical protein
MVVFDQEFNALPGAMEILSQNNEVQIAKVAWLSRKVNPKSYGSMVVYHIQPPFRQPHPFVKQKRKEHYQNSSTSLTRKLARINSYLKEASFIDYRNEWR